MIMKKLLLIIAILIAAIGHQQVKAQIPDDTDGRLYRLCKTWGYFKYFSQYKCELEWDTLLNTTINDVLLANSNAEFNDALMTMLNKVDNNSFINNPYPEPDTNINVDISWIDDPVFSQQVRDYLGVFSMNIYPDTSTCFIKRNDGLTPGYYGYIDFRHDTISMPLDYTIEADRLTAMFYYWNVINYFFPYRNITDIPWDSTLRDFIPLTRANTSSNEFEVTFLKLATRINDSHGNFTESDYLKNYFWGGMYLPQIYFTRVDTLCVVTRVQNIPGISSGDILTHLKGIPIREIEDSLALFIPASTPAVLYRDMYYQMMLGGSNTTLEMTLLDSANNSYSITTTRSTHSYTWWNWKSNPGLTSSYFITTCGYGYVNMGMLMPAQVPAMYNALKDAPVIIFDIRNYPNGTIWDLAPLFFPGPIISTIWYDPALTWLPAPYNYYYLPGWYYLGNDQYNMGFWSNPDPYAGNVYLLVNQETQSHGEYTCQYLSYHPNSRVMGTQTAGADGNYSELYLPGSLYTSFTSLGWYYADGYQQQRNGVKIDTVVSSTVAGIRQGRDEILEAAFDCLTGIDPVIKTIGKLFVYPNPVSDYSLNIAVTLENNTDITISLFNLTGRMIRQQSVLGIQGQNNFQFNIPGVALGLYLLKVNYNNEVRTTKLIVE